MGISLVHHLNNPVILQFNGGINPMGEYNDSITYVTGDSVSYMGSSYVAIQTTNGNNPHDYTYWQLLSLKGDGGTAGGTTGQALVKNSDTNFDNKWVTIDKDYVGLDQVDNTSDINKPISTATQEVLDLKVDKIAGKVLSSNDYTNEEKASLLTALQEEVDPIWNREKSNYSLISHNHTGVYQPVGSYALLSEVWKINGNTVGAKKTIGNLDNFDFGILTNNLERVTVLANGNVGIGTANPLLKLHIEGSGTRVANYIRNLSSSGYSELVFDNDTQYDTYPQGSFVFGYGGTGTGANANAAYFWQRRNAQIMFGTGNVERMRIDGVGNVGIGTTNPGVNLEIDSDANTFGYGDGIRIYGHQNSASYRSVIGFYRSRGTKAIPAATQVNDVIGSFSFFGRDASSYKTTATIRSVQSGAFGGVGNGNLEFWTADGTTESSKMTILGNGNVGIGTTNPSQKLQVDGNVIIRGLGAFIGTQTTDNNYSTYISLSSTVGATPTNPVWSFRREGYTNDFDIASYDGTVETPRLKILKNGNVGIGTTTPAYKLDILGTTPYAFRLKGSDGGGLILGSYNADWGGFWASSVTPSGTNFAIIASTYGTLFNAPSGSYVGFGIDGTRVMTINSAGNVGIGTTNPTNRLDVSGNAYISGYLVIGGSIGAQYIGLYGYINSDVSIDSYTGKSLLLQTRSGGNIGIGTTNPSYLLDVVKSSSSGSINVLPTINVNNVLAAQGDGSSTFNFSAFQFGAGNGAVKGLFLASYNSDTNYGNEVQFRTVTNHNMSFWTNSARRMTILNSGNVGIDTTSPSEKLDVNGTVKATGYKAGTETGITTTQTVVSDVRDNSGQMQKKTRLLTFTNGLLTAQGAESDWTNTTDI